MKTSLLYTVPVLSLLAAGCYKHAEQPYRPLTATNMTQAVELQQKVEKVDLGRQEVGDLPHALKDMPKLYEVRMRGATVGSVKTLVELADTLRVLDFSAVKRPVIPDEIFTLKPLEQLYLCENAIEVLPAAIGELSSLRYLNLDRNALKSVPAEIGKLVNLRWLRLNANKLESLPPELARLRILQRFYACQNQLKTVPEGLKGLPLLEDVSLSANPINELPAWLFELPKIRQLDFNDCAIVKIPEQLPPCPTLQILSMIRCPLKDTDRARLREAYPKAHIVF